MVSEWTAGCTGANTDVEQLLSHGRRQWMAALRLEKLNTPSSLAEVVVDQAKRNARGAVGKAGRALESDEQRKRWAGPLNF